MKGIVKVVNGILILQNGHSDAWTDDLQMQMANWTMQYVQWLEMNPLGTQESRAAKYVLVSICPLIPSIFPRPLLCTVRADCLYGGHIAITGRSITINWQHSKSSLEMFRARKTRHRRTSARCSWIRLMAAANRRVCFSSQFPCVLG